MNEPIQGVRPAAVAGAMESLSQKWGVCRRMGNPAIAGARTLVGALKRLPEKTLNLMLDPTPQGDTPLESELPRGQAQRQGPATAARL